MGSTDGRTRFASDTSVERLGPGRWAGRMDPSWWIINGPNGGYVAAVVLRAAVAEIDEPARRPRTIHVQYLRAPAAGPVEVEVTLERQGRTVTNVSARMSQEGQVMALALAVFAVERPSPVEFDEGPGLPTLFDGRPVPSPEQTPPSEVDRERDVPMRTHYDLRWALGDLPFRPADDPAARHARAGGWLRPAEAEPVDEIVIAAMTDAWLPPIFSRVATPLAVPTIDLTVHFRGLPEDPLDHCFVEFASPLAAQGYLVEHGRILSRDGRLLAESRQLAVVA
jgi:acyl-CoA thioesterase